MGTVSDGTVSDGTVGAATGGVNRGADGGPRADIVALAAISEEPLSVSALCELVRDDASGAIALFVGVVRDHDGGRAVTGLGYSAHPSAEQVLHDVVADTVADWPVNSVAAVHRVGDLGIGDIAVVVAVSCGHRADAFGICHRVIDAIKAKVPIWKRQDFADGSQEWVGAPG